MDINLPSHLEGTRQLLHGSLALRPDESAPAVPTNLLRDLQLRFTATRTLVVEAPVKPLSVVERFLSLFSNPAVGATAIIIGVLSFALPALLPGDSSSARAETFRGINSNTHQAIPIYISGGSLEMPSVLASTGDLEQSALVVVQSPEAAMELEGAKVIVDFEAGDVTSVDAEGNVIAQDTLPEEISLLSIKIAQAVSRL